MTVLIIGGTGYIGSAVYRHLLRAGIDVDTVDQELRGNRCNERNIRRAFQDLSEAFLAEYSTIILLAGHSSVASAVNDPFGAFDNNLVAFRDLLAKLRGQRLIYASSSSVYTGVGGQLVDENWRTFNFMNMYDFSKYACDAVSHLLYRNFCSLRFGTVNGPSDNMRLDLMINRMVWSGMTLGRVRMSNPEVRRPILGMTDLCRAVEAIVRGPDRPGIYNVASFNTTVAAAANAVAARIGCPIETMPPSPTYDFTMRIGKLRDVYGTEPRETLQSVIEDLIAWHGDHDMTDVDQEALA
jgi:nucleoside-diphosphate-sugar epimerase